MAKYTCVGVLQKSGEYNGKPYDNIVLQCLKSNPDGFGVEVEPLKVKTSMVSDVFEKQMTAADWNSLVGMNLTVYFGKFNVVDTVLINDPAESIADIFMRV